MFSALKRLAGRGDAPETANSHPSHQIMSANLQRKFAKGVQYNSKFLIFYQSFSKLSKLKNFVNYQSLLC